ncbi:MAG TPA: preprotein translocase subunit SecE [bacterium]|nr:preprotein translocase subunit SecE [bacterium]HPP87598.1 preprotein translocase subunit SecE [bacterium]
MNAKENWEWLKKFLKEVWIEANPKNGNVIWPDKKQIGATTIAVVIAIILVSIYVGILDYIFAFIVKKVI